MKNVIFLGEKNMKFKCCDITADIHAMYSCYLCNVNAYVHCKEAQKLCP